VSNALKRDAHPSRDKIGRMRPSEEIYRVALARLNSLVTKGPKGRNDLAEFRNVLMLAFLAACPLRSKNFANLRENQTLLRVDGGWIVRIPAGEVKDKSGLEFDLPPTLTRYLDVYFQSVRLKLLKHSASDAVWVNAYGNRMKGHS